MPFTSSRKFLTNLIQGSALFLLVLAAVYVSIGRILIANVDTYHKTIESSLSRALGTEARFDSIAGGWSYLDPSIEVFNLNIGGDAGLDIARLEIEVDAIATARERMLVVSEVYLEGVRIVVERIDGRWRVKGLPESDKPLNLEPMLTSLNYLTGFRLDGIDVSIIGQRGVYRLSSDAQGLCELVSTGNVRTFSLPLLLEYGSDTGRPTEPLLVAGHYQGDFGTKDFESELFLRLPNIDLAEFVGVELLEKYSIKDAYMGGETWLTYEGKSIALFGTPSLAASFENSEHEFSSQLSFAAKGRLDSELLVSLPYLEASLDDISWRADDINVSLSFEKDTTGIAATLASVELDELSSTVIQLGELGIGLDEEQVDILKNLNPGGAVQDLMFAGSLGKKLDSFKITANLKDVRIEQYKALPSVSSLNGFVSFTPESGFLDVVNEAPFELHFPSLFVDPWPFDTARTRISYEVVDGRIYASSGLVEMTKGELLAVGKVQVSLPGDPLMTTWGLELGVQNAALLDSHRYLPNTLKDDVQSWLKRAIVDGFSEESGMVFHGSLSREAAKDQKAHQIYFHVKDTVLDYDPSWPRFDDLTATIFVSNFEVSSNDAAGRIYDTDVTRSTVLVPISAEGVVDTILIDGELEGPVSDGLRVLTETPLFTATAQMADQWSSSNGRMTGRTKLNIPLGERAKRGEPTLSDVTVKISDAAIAMPQFDLQVAKLNGDFRYETHSALTSESFTAELFNQPVRGSVSSAGDIDGGEITILVNGDATIEALYDWSGQTLLTRAEGLLHYDSSLHVFYGDRIGQPTYVATRSDLVGVDVRLPEPMGKLATEEMALEYKQTFLPEGFRVEINMGDQVKASLKLVDGTLAGGRLHYGADALGAVAFDQLEVSGYLDKVNYEEWDLLSQALDEASDVSLESELAQTLDHIALKIGLLDVFGFELDDVSTRITRDVDAWNVQLDNETLNGLVRVLDDDAAAMEIDLNRISFTSEVDESGNALTSVIDPLVDVDPKDLLAARVKLKRLELDGEDYGSWRFNYAPTETGATMTDLVARVKGLRIADGAEVTWQVKDGQHTSQFVGNLYVPDLASALESWGYASSIEGTNFNFWSDVSWQGSPAMVDLEQVKGTVKLMQGSGRFVQAENNMGALRLLGIFDFASLMKRFRFDFSDVVKSGFSFDNIQGVTRFNQGIIDVVEPIEIEGSGSTFKVGGRVNLKTRELDTDMIVTLPVNRNLPWYAAYSAFATGPLTGAGVFLAQKVFQNQINAISSAKYKITGTVDEPVIEFVSIFSDSVRELPEEDAPTDNGAVPTDAEVSPEQAIPPGG